MLTHKGTTRIETPRLILRRFTKEDLEPGYYNIWSDYEVWKWTNYAPMHCVADVINNAHMFTENWLAAYEQPNRYSWAIELKETHEVIGRLFGMHPDDRIGAVELAYELGRKWWNRGYMTEGASAIIDYFIREVGFHRVFAYHASGNPASGRVMQKCGMTYEGTLRQAGKCNLGIIDAVYYSVLAEEYRLKPLRNEE
ncbi:MAG: GNAT family N-acetyltransferase [Clostridia bacterium]|nr:GNAT family N-acetyltransferase [Clostridia bacterium]